MLYFVKVKGTSNSEYVFWQAEIEPSYCYTVPEYHLFICGLHVKVQHATCACTRQQ